MSFKSLTMVFAALSVASGLGVVAVLTNAPVPPLALLSVVFLCSAAFGGMVLTYEDGDVQIWLKAIAFIGLLACTALANALQSIYGWIALAACGVPFLIAALFRYVVKRY